MARGVEDEAFCVRVGVVFGFLEAREAWALAMYAHMQMEQACKWHSSLVCGFLFRAPNKTWHPSGRSLASHQTWEKRPPPDLGELAATAHGRRRRRRCRSRWGRSPLKVGQVVVIVATTGCALIGAGYAAAAAGSDAGEEQESRLAVAPRGGGLARRRASNLATPPSRAPLLAWPRLAWSRASPGRAALLGLTPLPSHATAPGLTWTPRSGKGASKGAERARESTEWRRPGSRGGGVEAVGCRMGWERGGATGENGERNEEGRSTQPSLPVPNRKVFVI
nr:unnamed protein product [Digitaria exilis]